MTLLLRRPHAVPSPEVVPAAASAHPGPTTAQILRHGDHGIGVLEDGHGQFIIVRGRCHTLQADFSVEEAGRRIRARSAAVTRFRPEQRLAFRQPHTMSQLIPQLELAIADCDALGAFRIDAWFSFVRLQAGNGGSESARNPVGATSQEQEFSDILGTIVGFRNVHVDDDGSNALRLNFVDERRQIGGRIVDFEVLHGHAELAGVTQVQARD